MKLVIPAVVGLAAAAVAYFFALPLKFGAHPFWSDQVVYWGAPIGVVVGLAATRFSDRAAFIGLVVLALASYAIAVYGKARFAASYAEDAFGGQMWFFGWHAVVIFAIAAIVVAATKFRGA